MLAARTAGASFTLSGASLAPMQGMRSPFGFFQKAQVSGGRSRTRSWQEEDGYLEELNLWYRHRFNDATGETNYEMFRDANRTNLIAYWRYLLRTAPGSFPQRWEGESRWAMEPDSWYEGTSTTTIDDPEYTAGSTQGSYRDSRGARSTYECRYDPSSFRSRYNVTEANDYWHEQEMEGRYDGDTVSRWRDPDGRGEMRWHPDGAGEATLWDREGQLVARIVWMADGRATITYADGRTEDLTEWWGFPSADLGFTAPGSGEE